ncbi:MAG: hypothetical protein U0797_29550 [Gemmataceae bacterium]
MSQAPVERDYTLLAVSGLMVVGVLLVDEGLGWWTVVPISGGLLSVLVPGSVAVPFVLLAAVALLVMRSALPWFFPQDGDPSPLAVAAFAMGALAYVAGQSRVYAIKRHAVPPDARRRRRPATERVEGRWLLPAGPTRRSALPSGEVAVLAVSVPAFVLVAYLLWLRVALEPPPDLLDIPVPLWRVLVVAWAGLFGLAAVYVLTSYLRRSLASREESLMYLQDQLWAATRGEQRRINSWRVWGRLKGERAEGGR